MLRMNDDGGLGEVPLIFSGADTPESMAAYAAMQVNSGITDLWDNVYTGPNVGPPPANFWDNVYTGPTSLVDEGGNSYTTQAAPSGRFTDAAPVLSSSFWDNVYTGPNTTPNPLFQGPQIKDVPPAPNFQNGAPKGMIFGQPVNPAAAPVARGATSSYQTPVPSYTNQGYASPQLPGQTSNTAWSLPGFAPSSSGSSISALWPVAIVGAALLYFLSQD